MPILPRGRLRIIALIGLALSLSGCEAELNRASSLAATTTAVASPTPVAVGPSVTLTSTNTYSPTVQSVIPMTVTFSSSVTGFTAAGLSVANGAVSGFAGSDSTYTFNFTPTANTTGIFTIDIAAGAGTDVSGTLSTAATQYSKIYYKKTPTATGSTPTNSAAPVITVGNIISGLTASIFSNSSCTTSKGTITSTGTTQAITSSAIASSTNYYANVTDGGGNASTCSSIFALTYDITSPTVSSVTTTTAAGTYGSSSTVNVTVTFSKSVTVTGTPQITLATTPNAAVGYTSGTGSTALVFNYSPQVTDHTTRLDYLSTAALALNSGTILDAAGNSATLTLPGLTTSGLYTQNIGIRTVSQLVSHNGTTCAVVSGTLQCWGYNANGEIGSAVTTNAVGPVKVISSGVTQVAVGGNDMSGWTNNTTCAIVSGALKCWGYNAYGQTGNGGTSDVLSPYALTNANLTSGVSQVAIGGYGTICAIVTGGAVYCWGYNANSEVGNGGTSTVTTPFQVIASGATQVAIGDLGTTCALVSGAVYCWGKNSHGEVGNSTTAPVTTPFKAINSGATQISLGSVNASTIGSTCAVVNGTLECWGSNYYYSINSTVTTYFTTPTLNATFASGVTQGQSGGYYGTGCSLVSGALWCWGNNTYGSTGAGASFGGNADWVTTPHQLYASGATEFSLGGYGTTCAIISGALKCWGYNGYGECGNSDVTGATLYTPATIIASGVSQVVVATETTCAQINQSVACWGYNADGETGNGDSGGLTASGSTAFSPQTVSFSGL